MLKGLQMEMILGERGVGGWTEDVREACFRVSLKHASLWAEIFKKLRLKVEGVADGDDPGGKGGSCGWTEVVYAACFRVSLKHASLWAEIFKKLRLKVEGVADGDDPGKMGVVVGGQRSCTKHVSGLVSNMLRCVLKYSRK